MSNKREVPFPDEVSHLEMINDMLAKALEQATVDINKFDDAYMTLKRYMVENRGDIDPHEMFQNELALKEIDKDGAFAVGIRDKLAKLIDSPYFSRIDFKEAGTERAVKYYIGRFAFADDSNLHILDWRAPIASMFYEDELGLAAYEAPEGCINGELIRKRQFKIEKGTLVYAFESAVNIQDEMLQMELSATSDEKMKTIIASIQREQNAIIRDERSKTMIIQGVAGSGKTSIALHRIAYLLYRFKGQLSSNQVTIISPNGVFADYIAGVLPELGEAPIDERYFSEIASEQLENVIAFKAEDDPLMPHDDAWAERVSFKSTLDFIRQMDDFIAQMPQIVFEPVDYAFGVFTASAAFVEQRFNAYGRHAVKQRLQMMAEALYKHFESENLWGETLPKRQHILKALQKMLTVKNTLALYKMFYQHINKPEMLKMPKRKILEWADVFPFLYLHAAYEGLRKSQGIRHLIIDEMQDYTPIQYAVINQLYNCPKTILGDYGQLVNPHHRHSFQTLQTVYSEAACVELFKSYRSTYEIIVFAKQFKPDIRIEAIERHGEWPVVLNCQSDEGLIAALRSGIESFHQNAYATLGIIVKTNQDAVKLYDQLRQDLLRENRLNENQLSENELNENELNEKQLKAKNGKGNPFLWREKIHLIVPGCTQFVKGISITSVQMSKGLEFDMVILPFVDEATYHTDSDGSLLYIACTRAMHQLTLLHTGKPSPLLNGGY